MVFGQHKNYDITEVSYIYIRVRSWNNGMRCMSLYILIVNEWSIQAKYEIAFDLLLFLSLLAEQFHSVVNETRKWDY